MNRTTLLTLCALLACLAAVLCALVATAQSAPPALRLVGATLHVGPAEAEAIVVSTRERVALLGGEGGQVCCLVPGEAVTLNVIVDWATPTQRLYGPLVPVSGYRVLLPVVMR